MITLIPCGTVVKTKVGEIKGMITCQAIRFDRVTYEISYFTNSEQKLIWMHEDEFYTDVQREQIGFRN